MKLITQSRLNLNSPGFVKLMADNVEDIWNIYNMILSGDLIEAKTVRKVCKESNNGTISNTKKTFSILLKVSRKIEFK